MVNQLFSHFSWVLVHKAVTYLLNISKGLFEIATPGKKKKRNHQYLL